MKGITPALPPLPAYVEVSDGDRRHNIYGFSVKDIFKFGFPPYVIVGKTSIGKTTLMFDILYHNSFDATNIYLFTNTQKDFSGPLVMLPDICWVKSTPENYIDVWEDIKTKNEMYKKINSEEGINFACNIIKKIDPMNFDAIYKKIDDYVDDITAKSTLPSNADKDYYNINTKLALRSELIYKSMLDLINKNKDKLPELSKEERLFIHAFYSEKPKTILFFDDVTSDLEGFKKSTERVNCNTEAYNGKKVKDVIPMLMTDILTRGRHFNAIICIFIHDLNTLGDNAKDHLANLILFESAKDGFNNQRKQFLSEKPLILNLISELSRQHCERAFVHIYSGVENKLIEEKNKFKISYSRATYRAHGSGNPCSLKFNDNFNKFVEFYTNFIRGVGGFNNEVKKDDNTAEDNKIDHPAMPSLGSTLSQPLGQPMGQPMNQPFIGHMSRPPMNHPPMSQPTGRLPMGQPMGQSSMFSNTPFKKDAVLEI